MDSDNLYRIDGRDKITRLRSGLINGMALCGLPNGAAWISAFSGNLLLAGDEFSRGPQPADRRPIFDCAVSRSGRLWVNPVDDGCGIPTELRTPAGRPGRLGISGMHERTQRIGGVLEIVPGATGGTEMQLSVPARPAYRNEEGWLLRWWAGIRGRFARVACRSSR